jgi:hypothetical protein
MSKFVLIKCDFHCINPNENFESLSRTAQNKFCKLTLYQSHVNPDKWIIHWSSLTGIRTDRQRMAAISTKSVLSYFTIIIQSRGLVVRVSDF